MGVTQLRILAATEGPDSEPWRIVPSLQPARRRCLAAATLHFCACAPTRVAAASCRPPGLAFPPSPLLLLLLQCPGTYNTDVLDGLDFFLSELGKRRMRATVVLNDEWHWSGGMVQYVLWARGIASGQINASAPCVAMGTDANGAFFAPACAKLNQQHEDPLPVERLFSIAHRG